jgi:hypothetical protein
MPTPSPERVRLTVSVPAETLEIFRTMADAAGLSVGRCIGDWLADTADGAQFVAHKMLEAKRAPKTVMREMQAMATGLHGEVTSVLESLRRRSRPASGADAQRPTAPARTNPPSSTTGGKSPKPKSGGRRP